MSISGAVIYQNRLNAGVNYLQLDLGSVADGIYILNLQAQNETKTMKLVVQH